MAARRYDLIALAGGVAFCALFCAAVWLTAPALRDVPHLPDAGAAWYYWKLAQPTWLTRAAVWSLYLAHQLCCFAFIAWAQRERPAYTAGLHRFNVWALAVNAAFVVLHLVQTHLTYDGLAQDVHVFSSLGSVAVLLIWVLLMENPRRGLFFGRPVPLPAGVADAARRWHGFYFSWAIVYTFWFHPAEATTGHLAGFFYLLLVLLQGSLFFTRVHVDRRWTLALETLVIVHAGLVAMDQPSRLVPMFVFGFSALFIVTQMHGLSWSRALKAAVAVAWLAAVGFVWRDRPLSSLEQIARIPLIDYAGVALLTALFAIGLFIARRVRSFAHPTGAP